MVIVVFPFYRIAGRLNDAIGHADTDDGQGIMQTAVEHHVRHIPNPFKTKWKHIFSSLLKKINLLNLILFPVEI